jgi:L-2-hydroxyglutarate oxidase LhgO
MISMDRAREMEPSLVGYGNECIYSPTTSVMDTKAALEFLRAELESEGVKIERNTEFKSYSEKRVLVSSGEQFETDFLINAAGQDSLRIA